MRKQLTPLALTMTLALSGQALATETKTIGTTSESFFYLIAGQSYNVLVDWSSAGRALWTLLEQEGVSGPQSQLLGGGALRPTTATSSTATFTALTSGKYGFDFVFKSLLSSHPAYASNVSVSKATITGNFGVPGPVAGSGLAGLAAAFGILGFFGLRRRSPAA